uniref:RBR-type E3 ubiquitin transferase n=1 Tax=Timema californicum TaxID=61474 RepID=A0A7R9J906_TIMCA|nr:unnamed protein product [Timema californicum]
MRKSHDGDTHSTCSSSQRKRGLARFSLRRLLYSSPLVARRISRGANKNNPKNTGRYRPSSVTALSAWNISQGVTDSKSSGPSRDVEKGDVTQPSGETPGGTPPLDELPRAPSKASVFAGKRRGGFVRVPPVSVSCAKLSPNSYLSSCVQSGEEGLSECPLCQSVVLNSHLTPTCRLCLERRGGLVRVPPVSSGEEGLSECPLCLNELPLECFPELCTCGHRSCYDCFQQYLRMEISESRVGIACPECSEPMHPNDIRMILNDKTQYEKYEDFMVRRVLAVDPDTRWCPAPDCSFAVIAAGCASCPKIKCERLGCDAYFCYHCKAEWHPNQTCDAARAQRSPNVRSSSISFSQDSQHRDDIKPCPRCQVLIVKMDDGSCNHMTCAVCGAEFCWLCMKEISDLHYLSPSGCTFWGKKPWSRKKKILWQLGTLVGAPVGIGLVAGIAVPAMIIGIPVWVGRKLYSRYELANKHKRNLAIAGGVTASLANTLVVLSSTAEDEEIEVRISVGNVSLCVRTLSNYFRERRGRSRVGQVCNCEQQSGSAVKWRGLESSLEDHFRQQKGAVCFKVVSGSQSIPGSAPGGPNPSLLPTWSQRPNPLKSDLGRARKSSKRCALNKDPLLLLPYSPSPTLIVPPSHPHNKQPSIGGRLSDFVPTTGADTSPSAHTDG